MAQITLSRTEAVPFLDSSWQIMQMRNFEISVSVTSEAWETEDDIKKLLDKLFDEQRAIISLQIPLLRSKDARLRELQNHLKKKVTPEEYNKIILELKKI